MTIVNKWMWINLTPMQFEKGIVSKFRSQSEASLSELINFYFPWNHKKTLDLLIIPGGIEVN